MSNDSLIAKLNMIAAQIRHEGGLIGQCRIWPVISQSLSRYFAEHPYVFRVGDQEYRGLSLPAESDTGMFGGNSNWQGRSPLASGRGAGNCLDPQELFR